MELDPGEPPAGPRRVVPVLALVEQLHDATAVPAGRRRIVAIDGRGGPGKSTLAQRLQAAVPKSAVLHTDDIA